MLVVSPWLLASYSGWAQFALAVAAIVALGLWFWELAMTRPRGPVMPLSVLPVLLGVGLGICQLWPLSADVKQRVAAHRSVAQWEELGGLTAMDRDVIDQWELYTEVPPTTYALSESLPISLDPHATRLMTMQLLMAAIAYLLGAHYFHQPQSLLWLCLVLTINGLALAGFGIVQKMTSAPNEMFLGTLEVTGTVFGPYVNRNNAAGWLVMALSAAIMLVMYVFAEGRDDEGESADEWMIHQQRQSNDLWYSLLRMVHELDTWKLAAVVAAVMVIGGVLSTLSRGGTLAMILGSVIGFLVIGLSSTGRGKQGVHYLAVAVTLGLVLVGWLGFGQKLMERFDQADKADVLGDARVQNWVDTWPLFSQQWLLGSGLNTYQHVHRPLRSTPELATYVYAENQYFQTLIDAGLIGGILLVVMLGWTVYQVTYLVRGARNRGMVAAGTLGSVALGSQAVAAIFDFGLYMPANTLTFAVLMGAVAGQAQYYGRRDPAQPSLVRLGWGPGGTLLLLLLMVGGMLGALQFYRMGRVEDALLHTKRLQEKLPAVSRAELEQSIATLADLAAGGTEPNVQDALGQLRIHRYRVVEFQRLQAQLPQPLDETRLPEAWQATSPAGRTALLRQARQVSSDLAAQAERDFLPNAEARIGLLTAYGHFLASRRANPFRPELHLRLAELGSFLTPTPADTHLDRAVAIGPHNPRYHLLAGIQKLAAIEFDEQAATFEPAIEHLRMAIELDASAARTMEPLILKKPVFGVRVDGLTAAAYARRLLLDHPDLLLDFVNRSQELKAQPAQRRALLTDAMAKLAEKKQVFNYSVPETWAMGRIEMELGNWQQAKEQFDRLLQLNPSHPGGRYQRVLARIELGELAKAEDEIRSLLDGQPANTSYQRVLQRIQTARRQEP
jgi:tetratricopeptide (TPR) repeat protein/O-antigen ligase